MTKKEKRLNLWLKDKNFAPNKLKNIVCDICHGQSTHAKNAACYFCGKGVSKQELKKMDGRSYGYQFADIYNKRHCSKKEPEPYNYSRPRYFLRDVCMDCLRELEKSLNFTFKKSYAP